MRVAFVRHDPFGSVLAGVVRPVFRPSRGTVTGGDVATIPARVDVVDKGDRFELKVDLPGVSRQDINVAVEGARVSVEAKGAVATGAKPEQITILRAERGAAKYARTLQLPAEVDGDAAQAIFENGVLTLTLPKQVHVKQIVVR
jgi:HSP20 family protein